MVTGTSRSITPIGSLEQVLTARTEETRRIVLRRKFIMGWR